MFIATAPSTWTCMRTRLQAGARRCSAASPVMNGVDELHLVTCARIYRDQCVLNKAFLRSIVIAAVESEVEVYCWSQLMTSLTGSFISHKCHVQARRQCPGVRAFHAPVTLQVRQAACM